MRAHADKDSIYPFTPVPLAGWGGDNSTGKFVLDHMPSSKHIKETGGDSFDLVPLRTEATQYDDAAHAAVAAMRLRDAATETAEAREEAAV